jgi:hypothetical protein
MKHEKYWNSSAKWSSEKARLHALQFYVMRSIAKRYGGSVKPDPEQRTIDLTVPGAQGDACAREIEEQVGAIARDISTQVEALSSGEILIHITYN